MKKRIMAFLVCCFMLVGLLPMTAFAESGDVTKFEINPKGEYPTVQSAIDKISAMNDTTKTYLITVPDGEFDRFVVPHGVSNITIEGSGNTVIKTGEGTSIPGYKYASDQDTMGIIIWGANITLKNLIVEGNFDDSKWYNAAVSTHDTHSGAAGEKDTQVTLSGCTLKGNGKGIGFMPQRNYFKVENCNISGFEQAIYFAGDGYVSSNTSITGTTISDCTFAIHGYYGGGTTENAMKISGNTIIGTNERFAIIAIMDQSNKGSLKVDINNNNFKYTIVGGINLRKDGDVIQGSMEDLQYNNNFNRTSFIADAYWYAADDYGTTYYAPEIDGCIATWHANPLMEGGNIDGLKDKIEEALEAAGTTGNVVVLNAPAQETFTLSKNAILLKEYIDLGNLVIKKEIAGDLANSNDEFKFELVLTNEDDEPLTGTYDYIDADGTLKSLENGKLEFTLSGDEQITIKNLLPGTKYSVKEVDSKGYVSEPSEGYAGVIEAGENLVNFKNTLETPENPTTPEKPTKPEQPTTPTDNTQIESEGVLGISDNARPNTGDNSSMYLYIALAGIALIIIGIVVFMKKKNNHSKAN